MGAFRVFIDSAATERAVRRHQVAAAGRRAWQRVRGDAWSLAQRTAAATIAWLIARLVGDHPNPFFAPIAAVVALNASFGERGLNALRLLLGVIVGILSGETTVLLMKGGYGSLAVATFVAMIIARALGGAPVVVAQAAAGAILTIAAADGQVGPDRLIDACIGAGVALVFSQLLFTPEPVRLLRRAEAAALTGMAEALRLTARALADGDWAAGDRAMQQLRDLPEQLAVLGRTRAASARVARHSLAWRSRIAPVAHEQENAGHLDLLGVSCLMLTRTALAIDPPDGRVVSRAIDQVAGLLTQLARSPAEPSVRRGVVDRVPAMLRNLERDIRDAGTAAAPSLDAVVVALRVVTADMVAFAGAEAADPTKPIKQAMAGLRVTPDPRPARIPFLPRFLHLRRGEAPRDGD